MKQNITDAAQGALEAIQKAFDIMDKAITEENWFSAEIWLNNSKANLQEALELD